MRLMPSLLLTLQPEVQTYALGTAVRRALIWWLIKKCPLKAHFAQCHATKFSGEQVQIWISLFILWAPSLANWMQIENNFSALDSGYSQHPELVFSYCHTNVNKGIQVCRKVPPMIVCLSVLGYIKDYIMLLQINFSFTLMREFFHPSIF